MSNESTASETAPLHRADEIDNNNSSKQTPSQTSSSSSSSENLNNFQTCNSVHNNTNLSSSVTEPTNLASTTVTVANHNNNNIAVHLTNQTYRTYTRTRRMFNTKNILYRVGLDALILLCVFIPIVYFYFWGEAYKRGFFCDDESLMHPFKDSTVKNWLLYIIGLALPVGVIIFVETIDGLREHALPANETPLEKRYVFMGHKIPLWLAESYGKIGVFAFGAVVSQLTTDIAKYSIGRLRPHFFEVCQPVMQDGSTCADPQNHGKYIVDFSCGNSLATARMLKEARLSFPSGHSSFCFYTMVYLALYLQARMKWRRAKLFKHLLQFAFIMIAWYTALSRVSDYKHHWSDVLAGSAIGALIAVLVANFVSDLFTVTCPKWYPNHRYVDDTPPQTITINNN